MSQLFDPHPAVAPDGEVRTRLHAAVQVIARACDGAHDLDGVGFSGVDAPFGNMVASLPAEAWSDEVVVGVYELLAKYRRQLATGGVEYDALPRPAGTGTRRKASVRVLDVIDDDRKFGRAFVLRSGYDPALVDGVKNAFRMRRFEPADKSWRVAMIERDAVRAFVGAFGVGLSTAAVEALADEAPVARPMFGSVARLPGELLLRFPPDRRLNEEVKVTFPTRRFVKGPPAGWAVPEHLIRTVRAFAEAAGLELEPDVAAMADVDPEALPVTVTRLGGTLVIRFDTAVMGDLASRLGGVPGARFDWEDRAWTVPVEQAEVLLRVLDGCSIDLGADAEQLMADAAAMLANVERSRALDADLDLPEWFGMEPYPFQRAGIAYAVAARRCLIGDDMGLGKTVQALGVLAMTGALPAIVVCPASVKAIWVREVKRAMPHVNVVKLSGTRAPDSFGMVKPDIVVVNYDVLGPWTNALIDLAPQAIVFDESQLVKNPETRRAEEALRVSRAVPPDGVVLLLSGTPAVNRRDELVSQLDVMGRLDEFGTIAGIVNRDDLAQALRARCMVRRLKADVLPDLPPRIYVPVETDGDARLVAAYRRVEKEFLVWLKEWLTDRAAEEGVEDVAGHVMERVAVAARAKFLVQLGYLRRAAVRAKVPAAIAWSKEFLATDRKLLVFGEHLELCLHPIAKALDCPIIEGATPVDRRQQIVDRFQTDPDLRVLALSTKAAGVGLTLTAASDALFVELPWSPSTLDQALDRTYGRMNDLHGATGYELVLELEGGLPTIDHRMMALIEEKREEIRDALDGDVDTEDAEGGKTSILGDLVASYVRDVR